MADLFIFVIEIRRIGTIYSLHEFCEIVFLFYLPDQMYMVRHETKSIELESVSLFVLFKFLQIFFKIIILYEYLLLSVASYHNVVQNVIQNQPPAVRHAKPPPLYI